MNLGLKWLRMVLIPINSEAFQLNKKRERGAREGGEAGGPGGGGTRRMNVTETQHPRNTFDGTVEKLSTPKQVFSGQPNSHLGFSLLILW